jgi:hypothetical protein
MGQRGDADVMDGGRVGGAARSKEEDEGREIVV